MTMEIAGKCVDGTKDPNATNARESNPWSVYFQQVTKGSTQNVVAKRTGLDQATLSRWFKQGPGRPELVAQFARAYPEETTVLEAFVAAGFLRASESFDEPNLQTDELCPGGG